MRDNNFERSIFGETIIASRINDFDVSFNLNIPNTSITTTTANGGSATSTNGQAVLSSSTASNGSVSIETKLAAGYRPGHETYFYFTAAFTTGVLGVDQFVGLYDSQNGFMVGYKGTQFVVIKRKGGNDVIVNAFNVDSLDGTGPSRFTLDATKLNIYRIRYGWLGASPILYELLTDYGTWIIFHIFKSANLTSDVTVNDPTLPGRAEIVKNSGSTNIQIKIGCFAGGSAGDVANTSYEYFSYNNTKTISANVHTNIFTLKNESIFINLTHHIVPLIVFLGASTDGTKIASIRVIKNATLGGSPSYTSVSSNISVVSADTAGTTVTGGTTEYVLPMAKSDTSALVTDRLGITISPGDTLTFSALSTAASDVEISVRWSESH